MASTAKEDTEQSSSSASDGSWRPPPQAEPPEAEEDWECPICLDHMRRPAYVTCCMHKFCLKCIWQWSRSRDDCPVCRQPMGRMPRSVRGNRDYKELSVALGARLHRRVAMQRGLQQPFSAAMLRVMQALQYQQHFYGRSRPMDTPWQEAAPGPSSARSQQASHGMAPLREGERPAGPAAPLEPQNGTE